MRPGRPKKKDPKKPSAQLRVKGTPELIASYDDTAARWGCSDTAKFVRRLLDAARNSDPRFGVIHFHAGYDGIDLRAASNAA